jgi:hypothetical protein
MPRAGLCRILLGVCARATTLFSRAERYSPGVAYQRDGLPSCFSRCRFIMLGVQEGREGRQTVKSRDVRKALNSNKCKHFYYPTR